MGNSSKGSYTLWFDAPYRMWGKYISTDKSELRG